MSDTPRTDAFAASCMTQHLVGKKFLGEKANPAEIEWLQAIEQARQLERELAEAQSKVAQADHLIGALENSRDQFRVECKALQERLFVVTEALHMLYEDTLDYIRINNLPGAENNHAMKAARKALGATSTAA